MNDPSIVAPDIDDDFQPEVERYELREDPRYRFELDRRDFLKTLGGGILVVCLLDAAEAQPPGGGGAAGAAEVAVADRPPRKISARGCMSARTARSRSSPARPRSGRISAHRLTQAVAEELHVPPGSIQMVMADTQLTPFDMGTFGSRTTPDMSWRLRRAAAAAREALIDVAAEVWKTDRALLSAANGAVANSRTKESLDLWQARHGTQAHPGDHQQRDDQLAGEVDDRRAIGGQG